MKDDNRSTFEINLRRGLKMDLVTDKCIRRCIGAAVVLIAIAVVLLAAAPLAKVLVAGAS